MKKFLFVIPIVFLVAGCGLLGSTAETPRQALFDLDAKYQTALSVALTYESLPRCSDVQAAPCSKTDAVDKIRTAAKIADQILDAAEDVAKNPAATETALTTAIASVKSAVGVLQAILVEQGLMQPES